MAKLYVLPSPPAKAKPSTIRLALHQPWVISQLEPDDQGDEACNHEQLDHGQDEHEAVEKRCSPDPIGQDTQHRNGLKNNRDEIKAIGIAQVIMMGKPSALVEKPIDHRRGDDMQQRHGEHKYRASLPQTTRFLGRDEALRPQLFEH